MCTKEIQVCGLDDARTAYEVEQYLLSLSHVDDASADFLNDTVVVEYDEGKVDHGTILNKIEHSGCKPSERIDGVLDQLRMKLAGVRT